MKQFWGDYFLCFFVHQRAKNIYKRSFVITFLNVLISFLLLFSSFSFSQELSFPSYYRDATALREVLSDVLPDEVVVEEGSLIVPWIYDSFKEDDRHVQGKGYQFVLDARDPKTTFDDFTLSMVDSEGNSISYESYLSLAEEEKEAYSPIIERSGATLDTIAHLPIYESFLSSKEEKTEYLEAKRKYEQGSYSELEYANALYVLYGRLYYPEDVYDCDSYGGLPTIRSYYLSRFNAAGPEQNYVFLYQEGVECSFSSRGKRLSFFGDFSSIQRIDLSEHKQTNIDSMMLQSYRDAASLRFVAYLLVSFFVWFLFLLAFVLAVFLVRLVLSIRQKDKPHYTLKIMNLLASFLLFSCLFASILGIGLGFLLPFRLILILIPSLALAAVLLRALLYYGKEKEASDVILGD